MSPPLMQDGDVNIKIFAVFQGFKNTIIIYFFKENHLIFTHPISLKIRVTTFCDDKDVKATITGSNIDGYFYVIIIWCLFSSQEAGSSQFIGNFF